MHSPLTSQAGLLYIALTKWQGTFSPVIAVYFPYDVSIMPHAFGYL